MISAWKIWFHPRRARRMLAELEEKESGFEEVRVELQRRIDELVGERSGLQRNLSDTRERLEKKEAENAKLGDSVKTLGAQLVKIRQEYDALRRELENCRRELEEREEIQTQIGLFEKKLEQVNRMRQNYEQRIVKLRAEIVRLREYTGDGNPEADRIHQIDMRPRRPDDDWLMEL